MKVTIHHDVKVQIVEKLIHGIAPNDIASLLGITVNSVFNIFDDPELSNKFNDLLKARSIGMAFIAHNNISRIAFDPSASAATQLKASKMLVDIGKDTQEMHPVNIEPASMSQNQLVDTLRALEKERIKRAKPIDMGIIEADISIDSML
jgi:hypothetical protein